MSRVRRSIARRLSAFLWLGVMLYTLTGYAQDLHQTLPSATRSDFNSVLQNFLKLEMANRTAEATAAQGWIVAGCLAANSGSHVLEPFACTTYTGNGFYAVQASTGIDLSASPGPACADIDMAWVIITDGLSAPGGNFVQIGSSQYWVDCATATQPTTPSNATMLFAAQIVGGATTIIDLRPLGPTLPLRPYAHGTATVHEEQRARQADFLGRGYVQSGGQHTTSGTTSATIASVGAYVLTPGSPRLLGYVAHAISRTVTYSAGNGTYWLIAHNSLDEAVAGWTRVAYSPYLWAFSATLPALPARAVYLLQAVVAGGAITKVYDMRDLSPDTLDVVVERYGAIGDGVTDDHAAIEAACTAVRSRFIAYGTAPQTLRFSSGKTYRFTATAVCVLPDGEVFIEASGAKFLAGFDGLLLWLQSWAANATTVNGEADCTTAGLIDGGWVNDMRFFHWHGGDFRAPDYPSSTATTAIRVGAVRGLTIDNLRVQSLAIGLHVCIQDSFRMTASRIQALRYGIYQPDAEVDYAPSSGNTSGVLIQGNILGGVDTTVAMIYLCGGRMRSINILNNDFNGEATLASIYFCGAEENDRGANFTVNVKNNHFEQILSIGRYVWIDDLVAAKGWKNVSITGNQMVMPSAAIAVQMKNVNGAVIGPNAVSCIPGATMYKLEGDSRNIVFMAENRDVNCNPYIDFSGLSGGATRNDFTILPEIVRFSTGIRTEKNDAGVTLFDSDTYLDATGSATIQMSRIENLDAQVMFGNFPLPRPKDWWVWIQVHDEESTTSDVAAANYATPYLAVMKNVAAATDKQDQLICSPASIIDNGWRFCEGFVPADDDGNLYAAWVASGASNMKAGIFIKGYRQ